MPLPKRNSTPPWAETISWPGNGVAQQAFAPSCQLPANPPSSSNADARALFGGSGRRRSSTTSWAPEMTSPPSPVTCWSSNEQAWFTFFGSELAKLVVNSRRVTGAQIE